MAYSKQKLIEVLEVILNKEKIDSLGLPRATEEAAIELFLDQGIWNSDEYISIIREALIDLRDNGSFNYQD
jgi:hypothetical protein